MKKKGLIIIISAPSGAGKTTLVKALLKKHKKQLVYSVSATTRPQKKGERSGRDYFFLTEKEFKRSIKAGKFLEWAKVFGHYYGTPKRHIEECIKAGKDVLLEIDVQGALQLKRRLRDAVFIFILPPSLAELKRRLKKRGRETKSEVERRFREAKREIRSFKNYDYFVISHQVSDSVKQVETIIEVEKKKINRNKEVLNVLHLA